MLLINFRCVHLYPYNSNNINTHMLLHLDRVNEVIYFRLILVAFILSSMCLIDDRFNGSTVCKYVLLLYFVPSRHDARVDPLAEFYGELHRIK
jgi:hypothetical protein